MTTATATTATTTTTTTPLPPTAARITHVGDNVPCIVLHNISWTTYECLLEDFADRSSPRFAYDQGVLEIVSPTTRHEERKNGLSMVVEIIGEELAIDTRPVGSMTFRRQSLQRGVEPDASFYIQTLDQVRGKLQIDAERDPPPDLVIEIDVTHSSLDKLALYAGLGVPEIWRDDEHRVAVLVLRPDGEGYDEVTASRALPLVTGGILTTFLEQRETMDRPAWLRSIRTWVRTRSAAP